MRAELRNAGFHGELVKANVRGMRKLVNGLQWKDLRSVWAGYDTDNSYSASVPLEELLAWLASLGSSLIIELVTKQDPMVQVLLHNREDIFEEYDLAHFERWLGELFHVERAELLANSKLFFARP